jgi:hypothetical protein
MKTLKFNSREEWLDARVGACTGTKLKDIISLRGTEKKGKWQLIADKVAVPENTNENAMDRGTRLEPEAIEIFSKITKKKVDSSLLMWVSDDNDNIRAVEAFKIILLICKSSLLILL